jgi:hypothetical protein
MAYEHNVGWVPHGWSPAIGLAADLHLAAARPVARYLEYLTPSPYLDEIISTPFRPDVEGCLTVPERPGLGIELNREALKRLGVTGASVQERGGTMEEEKQEWDGPWKEALDSLSLVFELFWPDVSGEVDLDKGGPPWSRSYRS